MIYIVRVGGVGNSNICFCSPCHDCFNKFKTLGIKKIVYVNKDGNLEYIDLNIEGDISNFYLVDGHLNSKGHKRIAEKLSKLFN